MSKPQTGQAETYTAKIVQWDAQKGYGFLLHRKKKLFLHRRDFTEQHKRPQIGDKIHFSYGTDSNGRQCAVSARHVNDGGKITLGTLIFITILLLIPSLAIYKLTRTLSISPIYPVAYLLVINLITFTEYKTDKQRARLKLARTPEIALHLWEIIGGWPAALLAQRKYRHKCSKSSYQSIYWFIIILHLFISTDYLLKWRICSELKPRYKHTPSQL